MGTLEHIFVCNIYIHILTYVYIERGRVEGYVRFPASEVEVLNVKIHRCVYEGRVTFQLVIWTH
jgi:hypothetical protein